MAGLVETPSEASGSMRLGRVLEVFPDVSDEVSTQKKQAYLIRYEMYCCLPLRKPQDPALVFLFFSLLGQLNKFRIGEQFSSAEEREEGGSLDGTSEALHLFLLASPMGKSCHCRSPALLAVLRHSK